MLARRSFLRALPALGFGAKKAAEAAAAKLATTGLLPGEYGGSLPSSAPSHTQESLLKALSNQAFRSDLESLAYEENRCIYRIDADLAVLKSLSLNAKITFQRQRNVAAYLHDLGHGSIWSRLQRRIEKHLNPFAGA